MIFLSLGALLLSASPASADVTTGTCDPGQDPDQCECSTDLDDLGSCAVVSVENLVYPDDLTTLRSQIGATTTYDEDTELYHVAWNVSLLNNLAPVLPLHPNEGVWNSVADLNQYVADLLGVPLLSNGDLPNFELEQSGTLVRYDINNDQFLPSTGNLLLVL